MSRSSRVLRSPEPPRSEDDLEALSIGPEGLADGIRLEEVRLVDVDLSGVRVRGLRLLDVAVERGNLANLAAPELSLRRVALSGARLTGAQWARGTIADVVFRDCRVDLPTFAGTTF